MYMSEFYDRKNEEFLSYSPPLVPWHQVTSLSIAEPFNRNHLYLLFSQATNLRILHLRYQSEFDPKSFLKGETLINLLNDSTLCNMLMSNGLRQLKLFTAYNQSNFLNAAYSIVERLPHLQIIELYDCFCEIIEVAHILMNGLSKLSFLTLIGQCEEGKSYEKRLHNLQNSITRCFRTEVLNTQSADTVFVWLE